MSEIWKDIPGYEGLYQVSNLGNVKSPSKRDEKGRIRKERFLKPYKTASGYYRIGLCKNGYRQHLLVHRLVAMAFIPNPHNYPFINHKDENPANNCVYINPDSTVNLEKSNLEWCDFDYNIHYGTAIERKSNTQIDGKCSKEIAQYDLNGNLIKIWKSAAQFQRVTGKSRANVYDCANGKRNMAHESIWRYV